MNIFLRPLLQYMLTSMLWSCLDTYKLLVLVSSVDILHLIYAVSVFCCFFLAVEANILVSSQSRRWGSLSRVDLKLQCLVPISGWQCVCIMTVVQIDEVLMDDEKCEALVTHVDHLLITCTLQLRVTYSKHMSLHVDSSAGSALQQDILSLYRCLLSTLISVSWLFIRQCVWSFQIRSKNYALREWSLQVTAARLCEMWLEASSKFNKSFSWISSVDGSCCWISE